MTTVTCAVCSAEFQAKSPLAKYCGGTCRQRKRRGAVPDDDTSPAPAPGEITLVTAVQTELEAADALSSVDGQLAMRLARKIDKSVDTGSGIAALVRELKLLMTDAKGGSSVGIPGRQPTADEVDELRARRDAKLAAG